MGGCSSATFRSSKPRYLFVKNADLADSAGVYYLTQQRRAGKPVYKMMHNSSVTQEERYLRYGPKSGWYIGPSLDDYGYFFSDITLPRTANEPVATSEKGIEIRPVTASELYQHDKYQFLEVTTPDGDKTECAGLYRKVSQEFNNCPVYKMVGTTKTQQDRYLQYSGKQGWSFGHSLQGSQCLHSMNMTNIVPWADTWKGGIVIRPSPDGKLPEVAQVCAVAPFRANSASQSRHLFPRPLEESDLDIGKALPEPMLPSEIEIVFVVYAHHLVDTPQKITAEKVSIEYLRQTFTSEHFDYEKNEKTKSSDLPTVFIVHGFGNDEEADWMETMKDAFLSRYSFKCNVIKVGWGKGAEFPNYPQAVSNTQVVANAVAAFANTLVINQVVKGGNIHLVGHSLGAHICGQAGRSVSPNLQRVTALDPAGPLFEETNHSLRVGPDSAPFVDVIHTHGSGTAVNYGTMEELGDADFYPNDGKAPQPGCETKDDLAGLSHGRAYHYFTESITALTDEQKFWARSEKGVLEMPMGFDAGDEEFQQLIKDNPDHGPFHLDTSDSPQYSLGKDIFVTASGEEDAAN